jgi:hypothetical protein
VRDDIQGDELMAKKLTIERYKELKQEVDEAKLATERAKGALLQTLQQLQDEFDCGSLKEAKEKLLTLQDDLESTQEEFEQAVSDYEKKWKNKES